MLKKYRKACLILKLDILMVKLKDRYSSASLRLQYDIRQLYHRVGRVKPANFQC